MKVDMRFGICRQHRTCAIGQQLTSRFYKPGEIVKSWDESRHWEERWLLPDTAYVDRKEKELYRLN